jgi:hypothetical protein
MSGLGRWRGAALEGAAEVTDFMSTRINIGLNI